LWCEEKLTHTASSGTIIKSMEPRLFNISKALAQSAIDAYNTRATFMYTGTVDGVTRQVYNELLIGTRAKSDEFKLAKNITRVALVAHWAQSLGKPFDEFTRNIVEDGTFFKRAVLATHATLRKMIKETNYQRKLHDKIFSH